ncbi:hypothetical protein EJ04DRAFT_514030 [Polyplosphaeria fusca]|uniref:Uncharacterized protein n=1 Tax=Polyplosphaeria fusca TaxID=682080 RepID=A0A9P4QVQ3_9PLEO|nr:hypothetical protein EJ04DRAFT_514030 [Polyplosphaeria fusca]
MLLNENRLRRDDDEGTDDASGRSSYGNFDQGRSPSRDARRSSLRGEYGSSGGRGRSSYRTSPSPRESRHDSTSMSPLHLPFRSRGRGRYEGHLLRSQSPHSRGRGYDEGHFRSPTRRPYRPRSASPSPSISPHGSASGRGRGFNTFEGPPRRSAPRRQSPPRHYDSHYYEGRYDGYEGPSNGYEGPYNSYEGSYNSYEEPYNSYEGPYNGYEGTSARSNTGYNQVHEGRHGGGAYERNDGRPTGDHDRRRGGPPARGRGRGF